MNPSLLDSPKAEIFAGSIIVSLYLSGDKIKMMMNILHNQ